MKTFFNALIIASCWFLVSSANTIRVPQDQPSIQEGINAAINSDTVLVADSTYYENINFMGKAITVASYYIIDDDTNHINSTIINGSQPSHPDSGSVVFFISGEDTNSVICGFTINGGTGTVSADSRVGGGVYCYSSGASILHNKIINNSVTANSARGGGIGTFPFGNNNYSIVEYNFISLNTCTGVQRGQGGGIYMPQGTINHNIIRENLCQAGQNGYALGGGIHGASDTSVVRYLHVTNNLIEYNQCTNSVYSSRGGGVDTWGGVVFYLMNNAIKYNQASGPNSGYGGGVDLVYAEAPSIIQNNIISFNSANGGNGLGGGLSFLWTSGVTIQDNYFEGNTSTHGGGVFEGGSTTGTIIGNEFVNNHAETSGGACFFQFTTLTVTENIFRQNQASSGGGGIYNYSGNYQITNNTFIENQAHGWGGGINSRNNTSGNITGNEFLSNKADSSGGGCYLHGSNLTLAKNLFRQNSAKYGGGVLHYFGNYQMTNNIFAENTGHLGGGILSLDELAQNHLTEMINNTFISNTGDTAGAVFCENAKVILMNTICWGNTAVHGPEIGMRGGNLSVAYSDIRFGADSIHVGSGAILNWLDGNIDSDPLLVADSLSNISPCIGAGIDVYDFGGGIVYNNPPEDINGRARPYPAGPMPDMGAWESKLGTPMGIIEPPLLAGVPESYALYQNYPNPFNPSTTIEFALPNAGLVTLTIYNLLGEKVGTLVSENLTAGSYQYQWDAQGLASGVYLYQLKAGDFKHARKMLLVK